MTGLAPRELGGPQRDQKKTRSESIARVIPSACELCCAAGGQSQQFVRRSCLCKDPPGVSGFSVPVKLLSVARRSVSASLE